MPAIQKLSRRHPKPKLKRQTRITIPRAAGPHVRLVFAEMGRQNVTYDEVEVGAGVLRSTLKAWRHKNAPGLQTLEAVLGFLNWDFVPVPRSKVLPTGLLADLAPIAERHGLGMAKTIEALVGVVAGIHDGLPAPPDTAGAQDMGDGTDGCGGGLAMPPQTMSGERRGGTASISTRQSRT